MGQKSAEAIVDKESTTHGSVVAGNELGKAGMDSPCRRAELEEGDVILHELPEHTCTRPGTCMGRVMGIQLPRIITVTAVLSKN